MAQPIRRPGSSKAAQDFEKRTGIKPPRIVAWEITRSCNLYCAHCRAAAHFEPYPGELSLDECKALIDDIASITNPILILTGGEPLLRKDIWEIIDYAHAAGMYLVIGTNGTLIDDECARLIAEHGIPRVSVSLDFPTAEGQDEFRGKEGAFNETLEGIKNLRAHGVEVQVNSTITKINKDMVDDLHDLALSCDASAFHPFLLVPTGRGEDLADVELTPDEYEEVLTWAYQCQKTSPIHFKPTDAPQYCRIVQQQDAKSRKDDPHQKAYTSGIAQGHPSMHPHSINNPQNISNPHGQGMHGHPHGHSHGHPHGHSSELTSLTRGCLGGISFVFISHVGDVQPCGYFDMQLGNVKDAPFSTIWETSPVFDDLRHFDRLKGKCGACEYKKVCGGCRARALAATGDYLDEEPYCAYVPKKYAQKIVLDEIQHGFPLASDPLPALAERLGLKKEQIKEAIELLQQKGIIRRIGASFSSKCLGYVTTLCAIAIERDEQEVDKVADYISSFAEVTHNYRRDNRYNIWFTLIAPSHEAIEKILADIENFAGTNDILNLPATALYKIRVDFSQKKHSQKKQKDTSADDYNKSVHDDTLFDPHDASHRALVRYLQANLVDINHPFEAIASELGWSEDEVIETIRSWRNQGIIRRFGAFVRHRQIGFSHNGMTVWNVNADNAASIGKAFAQFPFVSHCYERPASDTWPYNLYAMVHATSEEELHSYVSKLKDISGLECDILVSTKEYKKTSPQYCID